MSLSNKQAILRWFYRREFGLAQYRFYDELVTAAKESLGLNQSDADQFAAAEGNRYWNAVLVALDTDASKGRVPLLHIDDPVTRKFTAIHTFLARSPDKRSRHLAVLLAARALFLRGIDALSDREYEALACACCEAIGATRFYLTPAKREEGVDFFAQLTLHGTSHLFGGLCGPLRIVGQCKRFETAIDRDKMKILTDTISEICHQSPRVEKHVPAWFRAGSGPVVGWMISHSGFQSGAVDKARHHGIAISDSIDLSYALAVSRRLAPSASDTHRVTLLNRRIAQILA